MVFAEQTEELANDFDCDYSRKPCVYSYIFEILISDHSYLYFNCNVLGNVFLYILVYY